MDPEIHAIAFGTTGDRGLWRPEIGRAFSTWIDPNFLREERRLLLDMIVRIIGATDGDVGFVFSDKESSEVRWVKDGGRPYPGYVGLTYPRVRSNGLMYGAEVVLHPSWVVPRVILHEGMHVLGMGDSGVRSSLSGGLDSDTVPDIDRRAWRWMASQPFGAAGFSVVQDVKPFVCR